jgi:hypothetical protein
LTFWFKQGIKQVDLQFDNVASCWKNQRQMIRSCWNYPHVEGKTANALE